MSINNSRFRVEIYFRDSRCDQNVTIINLPDTSLVHAEDFQPKTGA